MFSCYSFIVNGRLHVPQGTAVTFCAALLCAADSLTATVACAALYFPVSGCNGLHRDVLCAPRCILVRGVIRGSFPRFVAGHPKTDTRYIPIPGTAR